MTRRRMLLPLRATALLAAAVGCSRPGAQEPAAGIDFAPARTVSSATENGATPMFLITPAGDRVLSWVSAPGGGSDGRLNFSVVPAGTAEALPVTALADPLGPIQAHGEAPPQVAVDSAGRILKPADAWPQGRARARRAVGKP